jgi:predicted ATPase/transcriptional regulator with XRE-family HTH domain
MAGTQDEARRAGMPLATLVRQWRIAAGLSQEALAERSGLSANGIAQIETGKRTVPRASTLRMLADALELGAEQRHDLALAARPGAGVRNTEDRSGSPKVARASVPIAPTPLVGRSEEIVDVTRLLRDGGLPLVTLTGPGGVGKTRLALAVATAWMAGSPGTAAWVELASLTMPDLVPGAVARSAGVPDNPARPVVDTLVDALRDRHLLIVLDNCEHLLPAVRALGARLLEQCPEVRVLATSRAPLRLTGERLYPVSPLTLPDPQRVPALAELATIEAVALFVQRARAARPDFALTERNADAVAGICRRLDGLPLAIELAAARLRVLSAAALQGLLEERLRLLVGGPADAPARLQTLRAAVTWSHDLLTPHQQRIFRHLGVFAGGGTLAAIAAVTGDDDPLGTLEAVEGLVEQSMVVRSEQPDGEVRLDMLETFRAFALEQLGRHGETNEARSRHAACFLALAESLEELVDGPGHAMTVARLEVEHTNLLHALSWIADHGPPERALRLASAMMPYWHASATLSEANAWLERALELDPEASPSAPRATALVAAGQAALLAGDFDRARSRLGDGIEMARSHRAQDAEMRGLYWLGCAALFRGEFDEGREHSEMCLARAREAGASRLASAALWSLGFIAMCLGDHDAARRQLAESLSLAREVGSPTLGAYVLCELANLDYRQGHFALARERAAEARAMGRETGHQGTTGQALGLLAEVSRAQGDWVGADRYGEEHVSTLRPGGAGIQLAWALRNLAYAEMETGAPARAAGLFSESLAMFLDQGTTLGIASNLTGIASLAARDEKPARAERLVAAVKAMLDDADLALAPADAIAFERAAEMARGGVRSMRDGIGEPLANADAAVTEALDLCLLMGTPTRRIREG